MDALNHTDISTEGTNKLMLALAALSGIMGTTAAGMGLSGVGAESIPQLAAAAIPSVVAFLLAYLLYQTPAFSETAELPLNSGPVALLPESAEGLPQAAATPDTGANGMLPAYVEVA